MKIDMKKQLLVFATLGLTSLSMAGNKSGGGDYCELEGSKCERVDFEATSVHPLGSELIEMLKGSQIPARLKEEMLRDMTSTLVIYSGEKIKVDDLVSKYHMQIVGKETKTIKDADGKVTSIEETVEERLMEKLNDLDIYVHSKIGYKAGDMEDLYVRAVTEVGHPNRVIYFTPFVNANMDRREKLKLVLHEQGHRLKYLKSLSQDERFVEGWATNTLKLLESKITLKEYQNFLRASKLDTGERITLSNKKRLPNSPNSFEADLVIELTEEDVLKSYITSNANIVVLLRKIAFEGIPFLESDNVKIGYDATYGTVLEAEKFVLGELRSGKPIKLKVYYSEEVTDWESNDMPIKQTLDGIWFVNPRIKEVEDQIAFEMNELSSSEVRLKDSELDVNQLLVSDIYEEQKTRINQVLLRFKDIIRKELKTRKNKDLEFFLKKVPDLNFNLISLSQSKFIRNEANRSGWWSDGNKIDPLGRIDLGIDIKSNTESSAVDLFNSMMKNFRKHKREFFARELKLLEKKFSSSDNIFLSGGADFAGESSEEIEWLTALSESKLVRKQLKCLEENMSGFWVKLEFHRINYNSKLSFYTEHSFEYGNPGVELYIGLPAQGLKNNPGKLFEFIGKELLGKVYSRVKKKTKTFSSYKYSDIPSEAVYNGRKYKWNRERRGYSSYDIEGPAAALIQAARKCQ